MPTKTFALWFARLCLAAFMLSVLGGCAKRKGDASVVAAKGFENVPLDPAVGSAYVFTLKDGTRCVSIANKDVLVCDFARVKED